MRGQRAAITSAASRSVAAAASRSGEGRVSHAAPAMPAASAAAGGPSGAAARPRPVTGPPQSWTVMKGRIAASFFGPMPST